MNLIGNAVIDPRRLQWWQWGKILGLSMPLLFLSLGVEHLLLWALAVHFFVDFTAQSHETATGKSHRNLRKLAYHAFISGGYPGFIIGGISGLVISTAIHFLVDATNKFELDDPLGPALDQLAHIITLIAIWWLL